MPTLLGRWKLSGDTILTNEARERGEMHFGLMPVKRRRNGRNRKEGVGAYNNKKKLQK